MNGFVLFQILGVMHNFPRYRGISRIAVFTIFSILYLSSDTESINF